MPDDTRRTISASQTAALFDRSRWQSRWSLWHWTQGREVDPDQDERMTWGKRLEGIILEAALEELGPEYGLFRPQAPHYVRHPSDPLGATEDGHLRHPRYGDGAAEGKNVDYLQWKEHWTKESAPFDYESQLQIQMHVGDGVRPYQWGVIVVLVGGNDLRLYRRRYDPEFAAQAAAAAAELFALDEEPPLAGIPRELEIVKRLYPDGVLGEVRQDDDPDLTLDVETILDGRRTIRELEREKNAAEARLRAAARDAEILNVPGWEVHMAPRSRRTTCTECGHVTVSEWRQPTYREVNL